MTLSKTIRYNRQIYDTVLTDTQLDKFRSVLIQCPATSGMVDEIMNDLLEVEGCFELYYFDAGENFLDALHAYKCDHASVIILPQIVNNTYINHCLYFSIFEDYMRMVFDDDYVFENLSFRIDTKVYG